MVQIDEPPVRPHDDNVQLRRVGEFVNGLWSRIGRRARANLKEDCLQEARLSLWRCRDRLRSLPAQERDAYGAVCARRAVLRVLIRATADYERELLLAEVAERPSVGPPSPPTTTSDRWLDEIRHPGLAEKVAALSEVDRRIVHLSYAWGMTAREIARESGFSVAAVEQRQSRLLRRLRQELVGPPAHRSERSSRKAPRRTASEIDTTK